MDALTQKRCVPCEGGVPPLTQEQIAPLQQQLDHDWLVFEGRRLRRVCIFSDFRAAIAFVNRLADLAEEEGHHPEFSVAYNTVTVDLWTHAIGGLSENDFILAAKTDRLLHA